MQRRNRLYFLLVGVDKRHKCGRVTGAVLTVGKRRRMVSTYNEAVHEVIHFLRKAGHFAEALLLEDYFEEIYYKIQQHKVGSFNVYHLEREVPIHWRTGCTRVAPWII